MGGFSVRKTTEQFIEDAKRIHGNKYDYSKVDYVNNSTKVCIICPEHGEFWQTPNAHLRGDNCPKCKCNIYKKMVHGVGINDTYGLSNKKAHKLWLGMFERCYSKPQKERRATYDGCFVCEEWKYFSNFLKWFNEHYVDGWQLDKDILVKGNKEYGPKTCCFVPQEINCLFTKRQRFRGEYPIGVRKDNSSFVAECQVGNRRLRLYGFTAPEEAFQSYKKAKEAHIKEVADKWKGKIEDRVYIAMYNYEVELTD